MNRKNLKQEQQKKLFIEQLKKTPIVQLTAERVSVSRAVYYVWRKDDQEFAKAADEAIAEGSTLINDLAESQLISAIKGKDFSAIRFWLLNHHPTYAAKLQINANLRNMNEQLTPEQQAIVEQALRFASLIGFDALDSEKENKNGTEQQSGTEQPATA
jgi:hypothetical protein